MFTSNDKQPLVSVIVPTYNREKVLKRAIDSVLMQSYRNLELIIVDDGSADNTESLVNSYDDQRIIYHKNSENMGASGARNVGVEIAGGEFIAFQDSDDEWIKDKLEKQMKRFDEAALKDEVEIGLVSCQFYLQAQTRSIVFPVSSVIEEEKLRDIYRYLLFNPLISTQTMLLKKSVWKELGGFNQSLKNLEDWEFTIRIAEKYRIAILNEPLVTVNSSSDSLNNQADWRVESEFMIFKEFIHEYRTKEDIENKLASIVRRSLTEFNIERYKQCLFQFLDWLLNAKKYEHVSFIINTREGKFKEDDTAHVIQKIISIYDMQKEETGNHILLRGSTLEELVAYYLQLKSCLLNFNGISREAGLDMLIRLIENKEIDYLEIAALVQFECYERVSEEILTNIGIALYDKGMSSLGRELVETAYCLNPDYEKAVEFLTGGSSIEIK